LLHSLASVAPADANQGQIPASSEHFVKDLPNSLSEASNQVQPESHLATSQSRNILGETHMLKQVNGTSLSPSAYIGTPKPCAILPRYLADLVKQASVRSCKFTGSSGDSGVSSTSTSSSLNYHETLALRVRQRAPAMGCGSPTPPRSASLLEKYTREH
uniref:GLI1 protein n=1 Tax=Hydatigena taeniaeformis TaxID=6205 RepID=A0A0R3XA73_HYDTA